MMSDIENLSVQWFHDNKITWNITFFEEIWFRQHTFQLIKFDYRGINQKENIKNIIFIINFFNTMNNLDPLFIVQGVWTLKKTLQELEVRGSFDYPIVFPKKWFLERCCSDGFRDLWDYRKLHFILNISLTLFRMGFLRAAHGYGGRGGVVKRTPSLKSVTHILQLWNLEQLYLT